MATDRPGRLLRRAEHPRQASVLELFFDLAFIVTLTILSQRLLQHLNWLNVAQTLVLLAAAWWIWIATAWSTDWFNPAAPFIQRLVLGVMFTGLFMAAAIPQAFGPRGIVFAVCYSAIHLGRGLVLAFALRGHPLQRRTLVVGVWFGLSAIPWLAGAFLPPNPRLGLWLAAIIIDYTIAWFGWPTPRLGRVSNEMLHTIGEHLSERYRQVFIIALGEIILVSGMAFSNLGFDLPRALAYALSFANAALLWWIYLVPALRTLGTAIDQSPPRIAVSAAYCHLVMIAGTVLSAVGDEVLITHPLGPGKAAWTGLILGGTALFLAGRILIDLLISRGRSLPRMIGLVATLGLLPAMLGVPPLGVAGAANGVLLLIGVEQMISNRTR